MNRLVIFYTVLMLTAGTANLLAFKLLSMKFHFKYGFFQSFIIYLGMYLNLVVLNGRIWFSKTKLENDMTELRQECETFQKSTKVSKIILSSASMLDVVSLSLQNIALFMQPASVNQLLCSGSIMSTCIFSKFMLGRQIYRHHWLGNIFALFGFFLVFVSTLLKDQDGEEEQFSTSERFLGVILVATGLMLQGIQYNWEEFLMIKYAVQPERLVGLEGMFGLMYCFLWMNILSFFNCTNKALCYMGSYVEDPIMAFKQIFNEPGLLWTCLIIVFSVMFFNMSSMNLTKRVSCIYYTFWSATRTIFVWIIATVTGLEKWQWLSSSVQLLGFVFLMVGNLTYNEIIEWKIWNLNKMMSKYLKDGGGIKK